jgi:hypothetical protein
MNRLYIVQRRWRIVEKLEQGFQLEQIFFLGARGFCRKDLSQVGIGRVFEGDNAAGAGIAAFQGAHAWWQV